MFYLYILTSPPKNFYIGYTADLRRRLVEHGRNQHKGWKLLYYEAYATQDLARERELTLKQYGGGWRNLRKRLGV